MAHSEAFYKKPEECHYSFFQHKECEFFPCHKTDHPEDFNCLFCYCPLFALGKKCKGNFRYTETGVKDSDFSREMTRSVRSMLESWRQGK